MPASRQISTRRRASTASLTPQAWKNSPFPPNVPAPKLRTGTLKPDAPSLRNSTLLLLKLVNRIVGVTAIEALHYQTLRNAEVTGGRRNRCLPAGKSRVVFCHLPP